MLQWSGRGRLHRGRGSLAVLWWFRGCQKWPMALPGWLSFGALPGVWQVLGRNGVLLLCSDPGRFLQKESPPDGFRSDGLDFGFSRGFGFVWALCPECQSRKKMPCSFGCEGGGLGKDLPCSGLQKPFDLSLTDPCPGCGLTESGIDH